MVTVLQLNRLELKDMITEEIAQNPVLEEAVDDGAEELAPEEMQAFLEAERDPAEQAPADQGILETVSEAAAQAEDTPEPEPADAAGQSLLDQDRVEPVEAKPSTDAFEEIDFGSFFDDYLDPGYKSPASETIDKPSFETFLSSPFTLTDHLHAQLSVLVLPERVRDASELILGNLDENGYLTVTLDELAAGGERNHRGAPVGSFH